MTKSKGQDQMLQKCSLAQNDRRYWEGKVKLLALNLEWIVNIKVLMTKIQEMNSECIKSLMRTNLVWPQIKMLTFRKVTLITCSITPKEIKNSVWNMQMLQQGETQLQWWRQWVLFKSQILRDKSSYTKDTCINKAQHFFEYGKRDISSWIQKLWDIIKMSRNILIKINQKESLTSTKYQLNTLPKIPSSK